MFCESQNAWAFNCVIAANSAYYGGGGASGGTLNNCVLKGNSAYYGGGAYASKVNNCTLTDNSATGYGGGIHSGTLNNCIVFYNTASTDANYSGGTLNPNGTSGGLFNINWVVSAVDKPTFGLKTITVTTTWTQMGKAHEVHLAALVRCSKTPC